MSQRNSIRLSAKKVTVEATPHASAVTVTVLQPSEDDLVRIISEASKILEWKRRREPKE